MRTGCPQGLQVSEKGCISKIRRGKSSLRDREGDSEQEGALNKGAGPRDSQGVLICSWARTSLRETMVGGGCGRGHQRAYLCGIQPKVAICPGIALGNAHSSVFPVGLPSMALGLLQVQARS